MCICARNVLSQYDHFDGGISVSKQEAVSIWWINLGTDSVYPLGICMDFNACECNIQILVCVCTAI